MPMWSHPLIQSNPNKSDLNVVKAPAICWGFFVFEAAYVAVNERVSQYTNKKDFLSCLCGSELFKFNDAVDLKFLSCLCGSEQLRTFSRSRSIFLSCLCGSEQSCIVRFFVMSFLSCLCGSELVIGDLYAFF